MPQVGLVLLFTPGFGTSEVGPLVLGPRHNAKNVPLGFATRAQKLKIVNKITSAREGDTGLFVRSSVIGVESGESGGNKRLQNGGSGAPTSNHPRPIGNTSHAKVDHRCEKVPPLMQLALSCRKVGAQRKKSAGDVPAFLLSDRG